MTTPAVIPQAFKDSAVGKTLEPLLPSKATGGVESSLAPDELRLRTLQVRALVARLMVLPKPVDGEEEPNVTGSVDALLDRDLVFDMKVEIDPTFAVAQEYRETVERLRDLLKDNQVLREYTDIYELIHKQITQAKQIVDAYDADRSLSPTEKISLVRQLSRLLQSLIQWCEEEEQNVHNQIVRERRGYRKSDTDILQKLKGYKDRCKGELNRILAADVESKIQLRRDEIKLDKALLMRRVPKDVAERNKGLMGKGYIVTPSRAKLLFGSEDKPDNSIMTALRKRHNVELFGPTGTGKTKLAEHAALLFSGKPAVVVPGNPGLSKYDFLGKTVGLDKRDEGALIKCLKEGRVLIVDEDNRIDPRVLSVIKYALGLKVGDVFIHPETGEEIPVPPGFGVIVTRNEKGKHHKDRNDLPPEYRREFTHGSFEIGYFTKDEMYDHFLVPKLTQDDGSMNLSDEEVGGNFNDPAKRSPLLSLVVAAEDIQTLYRENKMIDGVFESGFLIEVLDNWNEQHIRTKCSFIDYLETRLVNFIKRPIGNAARKLIIQKLVEQGFFSSKQAADFVTQDEGAVLDQAEFDGFRGVSATAAGATSRGRAGVSAAASSAAPRAGGGTSVVFRPSSGIPLDARAVALLDPFEKRKVVVRPHPLEAQINAFKTRYMEFCRRKGIQPIIFSPHNFGARRGALLQSIAQYIEQSGIPNRDVISALISVVKPKKDEEFMPEFISILDMLP